jgi:hypothetical protein
MQSGASNNRQFAGFGKNESTDMGSLSAMQNKRMNDPNH